MFRSKKKKSRSSPSASSGGLFSWAGNFALFYVILLTLITIPFLILFVILSIRTALDYHVWILAGVFVLAVAAAFLVLRRRKQIRNRFEEEKKDVMEVIRMAAREGHNVNISLLHGLVRLDYQSGNNDSRLLETPALNQLKALPMDLLTDQSGEAVTVEPRQDPNMVELTSVARELERLTSLFDRGVLTGAEFRELKERLLKAKAS
jgi:hypothetical protein